MRDRIEQTISSQAGSSPCVQSGEKRLFLDLDNPVCPILLTPFTSPVPLDCGHVFEENAIKSWFWDDEKETCPCCVQKIGASSLTADLSILDKIYEYAFNHKIYSDALLKNVLNKNIPEELKKLGEMLCEQPEKLNKLADEKEDQLVVENYSPLYILIRSQNGKKLLHNDLLREKIDVKALNHIIQNGREKELSSVFWLCATLEGVEILLKYKDLRDKIEATALNQIITAEDARKLQGRSALYKLVSTSIGRKILSIDSVFRNKISAFALNYEAPCDDGAALSPAKILAQSKEGRELLLTTELRSKLDPTLLSNLDGKKENVAISHGMHTRLFAVNSSTHESINIQSKTNTLIGSSPVL
ncbi:MAG: U-box domain-containing protein [Gammaproteobacteria bacterium]